jgi:hypothetical protein
MNSKKEAWDHLFAAKSQENEEMEMQIHEFRGLEGLDDTEASLRRHMHEEMAALKEADERRGGELGRTTAQMANVIFQCTEHKDRMESLLREMEEGEMSEEA